MTALNYYPGDGAMAPVVIALLGITLVSAAGLLMIRPLRHHPAARHAVLLSALICILLIPMLVLTLDHVGVAILSIPWTVEERIATAEPRTPIERNPRASQPLAGPDESNGAVAVRKTHGGTSDDGAVPVRVARGEIRNQAGVRPELTARRPPRDSERTSTILRSTATLFLGIWVVGTVLLSMGILRSWRALHRIRRDLRPIREGDYRKTLSEVRRHFGLEKLPDIGISGDVSTPVVAGLLRPVVILPRRQVDVIGREPLRHVLVHEVAHVIRRDNFIVLLQAVAKALFWIHPLVHLLNRGLARAREEVCDNHVLVRTDAVGYGETLLRLAELASDHKLLAASVGILHWRGRLEHRISNLLDERRSKMTRPNSLAAFAVFAAFAVISALICGTKIASADRAGKNNEPSSSAPKRAAAPREKPVDFYGDPLPDGAVARLGTIRLRHGGMVLKLAVSPDGKTLATWSDRVRGVLSLWELPTGKLLRREEFGQAKLYLLAWFKNGKSLAVVGSNDGIRLWNFADQDEPPPALGSRFGLLETRGRPDKERYIRFAVSPDGKLLAAATGGFRDIKRRIQFFEVETGIRLLDSKPRQAIRTKRGDISWLSFTPDGKSLIAISRETGRDAGQDRSADPHALTVYDVAAEKPPRQFDVPGLMYQSTNRSAMMSPDGRTVAIGTRKGPIHLFDLATGKQTLRLPGHQRGATCLVFSLEGSILVSGGRDQNVRRWDLKTGKQLKVLGQHLSGVEAVAVLPDGKVAVSGGQDSRTRLWNMDTGRPIDSATGHEYRVLDVDVSRDGRLVVTGGADCTLRTWDAATGWMLNRFDAPGWVNWTVLHPDGKSVFTGNEAQGSIRLLQQDLKTGKTIRRFGRELPRGVYSHGLSISGDGKLLVSAHEGDRSVRIWDAATGRQLQKLLVPAGNQRLASVAVSPDGKTVALAYAKRVSLDHWFIQLWQSDSGAPLRTINVESGHLDFVSFSPDGKTLVSAGTGSSEQKQSDALRLWDVASGKLLQQFAGKGRRRVVRDAAFTADGKRLVSAENSGSLIVFDVPSGKSVNSVAAHAGAARHVTISADGRRIVSAGDDLIGIVWDRARLSPRKKLLAGPRL